MKLKSLFASFLLLFFITNLYCQENNGSIKPSQDKAAFTAKILTSPAKIRTTAGSDKVSIAEFGVNNVGLLIGFTSKPKEETQIKKEKGVSFGVYVSFSSIKLNNENTMEELLTEKERLGRTIGGVLFRDIKNLSIGVGFGIERLNGTDLYKWKYNKRLYLGVFFGYSLN